MQTASEQEKVTIPASQAGAALERVSLMQFDAKCYRSLCIQLLNVQNALNKEPDWGKTTSYGSLFVMLSLDMTVFIDGSLKLLGKIRGNKVDVDGITGCVGFEQRLKSVRNSMHLYNKQGPYYSKAKRILSEIRGLHHTDTKDFLYLFRNDEALVYEIGNEYRYLRGALGMFYRHVLDYSKFAWTNDDQVNYSQHVAAIVNTFAKTKSDFVPEIDASILSFNEIRIESFDDKIADLFSSVPITEETALRLMLILTRISYAIFIYKVFIEGSSVSNSPEWLVFFTKWFAMHLDEVIDSIDNLLRYSIGEDQKFLVLLFSDINLFPRAEIQVVIRNLRNLIHYDIVGLSNKTTHFHSTEIDCLYLFKSACRLSSLSEILELFEEILRSLFAIQTCLCHAFGEKGIVKL
jgi:hypothetical protein